MKRGGSTSAVPLRYHHRHNDNQHSWAQPSPLLTEKLRSTTDEIALLASGVDWSPEPEHTACHGTAAGGSI